MNKKLTIPLLAVLLLFVYLYWGTDYIYNMAFDGSHPEHEQLSLQIDTAKKELQNMHGPSEELEQQLAELEEAKSVEQNKIPAEIDDGQLIRFVLQIAQDCNVKAIPLVTRPLTSINVENNIYSVLQLNVNISGEFDDCVAFINRLENSSFGSLIIEQITISADNDFAEGSPDEGSLPIEGQIRLLLYAQ